MASETKRTAPDMDAIIANAKKEANSKQYPWTGRRFITPIVLWFQQAMLTRN